MPGDELDRDPSSSWLARRPAEKLLLPLANLRRDLVLALIEAISQALAPGGMYIQFQYSLLDRKKVKAKFSKLTTVPVLLNFPPAVVYYARK